MTYFANNRKWSLQDPVGELHMVNTKEYGYPYFESLDESGNRSLSPSSPYRKVPEAVLEDLQKKLG